jgi:oligopeptidase B
MTDGYLKVWDNLNSSIFYNVLDDIHRSHEIKRHVMGTSSSLDTLVYREDDKKFSVGVGKTSSDKFIIVETSSSLTYETHYIDADEPDSGNFWLSLYSVAIVLI